MCECLCWGLDLKFRFSVVPGHCMAPLGVGSTALRVAALLGPAKKNVMVTTLFIELPGNSHKYILIFLILKSSLIISALQIRNRISK